MLLQEGAMKNSAGMLASHHFSRRQLQGVSVARRKRMLLETDGVYWEELPSTCSAPSSVASSAAGRPRTGTGAPGGSTRSASSAANGWPRQRPCSTTAPPSGFPDLRTRRAGFTPKPCAVHHPRLASVARWRQATERNPE